MGSKGLGFITLHLYKADFTLSENRSRGGTQVNFSSLYYSKAYLSFIQRGIQRLC